MFISNNIYIVFGNIPICLVKIEKNFTKRNFYFSTQFMSKRSFYFEMEGVTLREAFLITSTSSFMLSYVALGLSAMILEC